MKYLLLKPGEILNSSLSVKQRILIFVLLFISSIVVLLLERIYFNGAQFYSALILVSILFYMLVSQIIGLNKSVTNIRDDLLALHNTNYSSRLALNKYSDWESLIVSINDLIGEHEKAMLFIESCSNETSFTASELENKSTHLSSRTGEQRQRLEAAASASEEMSVTVSQINNSVSNTHDIAISAFELSESSSRTALDAVSEIETVADTVKTTATMLDKLDNKASEIISITDIINEITNQIHLLALNAAIESARAGEAGRGFAVVAGEIRTLAGRTSNATKEISNVLTSINVEVKDAVSAIENSQQHVEQGVLLVQDTHCALKKIEEGALSTKHMVEEMLLGFKEHAEASNEMARSIEEISVLAQENHGSSSQMQEMVLYLRNLSDRFSKVKQG
jgi:methyl-accepting chemotaxis protein